MSARALVWLFAAVICAALPAPAAPPLPRLDVRAGPAPDYGPVHAVWTHVSLTDMRTDLPEVLDRVLGRRHLVETYTPLDGDPDASVADLDVLRSTAIDASDYDNTVLWMRDYQPIYVRTARGHAEALRPLHVNLNRSAYVLHGDPEVDPWGRAGPAPDGRRTIYRRLPLIHENGNLVVAGRWVLVGGDLLSDNAIDDSTGHLKQSNFRGRSPAEVVGVLARALHRAPDDIVVLPPMPGEETGHVDIWVLPLDDHTVVVPEVRDAALLTDEPAVNLRLAVDVQRFLDDQADALRRRGLRVTRLPMVPPLNLPSVDGEPPDPVFYSPANSLLLDLRHTERKRRVAVMPAVDLTVDAPRLATTQRRYEGEWSAIMAQHGWQVEFAEATYLGRYLGLIRCVTHAVPAIAPATAPRRVEWLNGPGGAPARPARR